MMGLVVERLENSGNWDEEPGRYNGGLFMTSAWLKSISGSDRKPVFLRFIEDNKPVAVLGGLDFFINNGQDKQLFCYSGIIAGTNDPALIKRCKKALYQYALQNGYHRITIRSYDYQSCVDARVNQFIENKKRSEYIIYLDKDKDSVINGFSKSIRQRARKAKKEGAVLRKSHSPELTETLLKIINETYNVRQSKGYGAFNIFYLPFMGRDEIERLVNDRYASFHYTERDNEILSISLDLTYQKKAYGLLMGTSSSGYKAGSPSFHYFELICMLKDEGYSYFNLGGRPRNARSKGMVEFKDRLGPDIVESVEENTNFLTFPLKLFNPLLRLKRVSGNTKIIPGLLKNAIIRIIDIILPKRDLY